MREISSTYIQPPPPPPSTDPPKSNLPMLYYGLVVVGTAAIVLALYNLIIIKWCTHRYQSHQQRRRQNRFVEATTVSHESLENMNRNLLSSFKYKKDMNITARGQELEQEQGIEHECAVCLSVFEEGEEVRQLPRCKHSFHAPCIDMWLYSHSDCPLCRVAVDVTRYNTQRNMNMNRMLDSQEHSRENLLN